ncbi:hypothetical protein ABMA28_006814 [Loxostege sticticalis]|uniref:Monocarboxylate transporter n=1 Tax=Loxostege sticticalis TaxID=481309 RepID=A0ABD0TNI7_LOXSC
MSLKEKCDTKYDLVAPDGGWGYMICIAGTIILISFSGFVSSFGLIYNDFMAGIGFGSTEITFLNGITAVSMAFGGFITSPLQKIMSMRKLALVGVLTYNLGIILVLFVKSAIPFYTCVGVIQGTSFGLVFNLTYAMINEYFVEKRLLAYSVVKTTMAIFAMFAPQLVKYAQSEYGFKGTILMVSAVSLQSLIAVALMQPVTWHMKKVEKQPLTEDTKVLLVDDKDNESGPIVKLTDLRTTNTKSTDINESSTKYTTDRKSSWLVQILKSSFDVTLLKSFLLSNVAWGIAISILGDTTFLTFIPAALYSYGWNKDNVALALSLVGFGDLAGRGCFIICSKWLLNVGSQDLFIAGLLVSVAARVSILCFSNVTVSLVFMVVYGIGRCFLALFLPMVICEVAGTPKFTAGMGLVMVLMGCVNISCGPIFGAIRDYTQSYDITFWILAATLFAFSISWTIELVYKRRQRSNKENKS